ncbi:MAG: PorT family protein [Prevotella sp.]|nr:PorT family protein [Prevotella sp.]
MKFILKISLWVFSLLLINCLPANAQYPKKRMTADFRMGMNYPQMSGTRGSEQFKMGLHIGGNVNYKIIGNFQVQTGFYVTKKGYKTYQREVHESENNVVRVDEGWYEATGNYIQMPFNIGYELYVTQRIAFNINGGVYAAYGYGNKGKTKYKGLITTYKPNEYPVYAYPNDQFEELTFSDTRWKRSDYGLNGSIGFIYDIYTINFNYEHGLCNVTQERLQGLKHRVYSVSLGFRF